MRILVVSIILLITHILQATFFQSIRIGNVAPNFMIMFIVSFSLLRGSKEGSIIGGMAGLLQDITFGASMGMTALTYGLIGYCCGKFNKNFYRENFILPFSCTLFASLFTNFCSMFAFFLRGKVNVLFFLKTIIIPEMIYTITLSLVVYQLTYIVNEKLEFKEKKTRSIF